MSKLGRKLKRKNLTKVRAEDRKKHVANREVGPCYMKDCAMNGDFIEKCRFCDYKVQVCTMHHPMGQQKAAQHVFAKHPAKAVGIATVGVLRGQKFYG